MEVPHMFCGIYHLITTAFTLLMDSLEVLMENIDW